MRIEVVSARSLFFNLGDFVRLFSRREYVIVQFSREVFPEYPAYVKWELHLDWPENHSYDEPDAVTHDFVGHQQIMSWRTFGILNDQPVRSEPKPVSFSFDMELTPEVRAYYEHVFGPGTDREQLIRAEVEAMDWPEVIGDD